MRDIKFNNDIITIGEHGSPPLSFLEYQLGISGLLVIRVLVIT